MAALSFRSLSFTVAGADLSVLLGTPVTPCLPFLPSLVCSLKGRSGLLVSARNVITED